MGLDRNYSFSVIFLHEAAPNMILLTCWEFKITLVLPDAIALRGCSRVMFDEGCTEGQTYNVYCNCHSELLQNGVTFLRGF